MTGLGHVQITLALALSYADLQGGAPDAREALEFQSGP